MHTLTHSHRVECTHELTLRLVGHLNIMKLILIFIYIFTYNLRINLQRNCVARLVFKLGDFGQLKKRSTHINNINII